LTVTVDSGAPRDGFSETVLLSAQSAFITVDDVTASKKPDAKHTK